MVTYLTRQVPEEPMLFVERRRKRSSFWGLALQYWLGAVSRRTKLVGLVLADSAGLLVASSLRGPEAEELAAMAPLVARPRETASPRLPMSVKRITIDRSQLYLCAVGGSNHERGLQLAENGIQRILITH